MIKLSKFSVLLTSVVLSLLIWGQSQLMKEHVANVSFSVHYLHVQNNTFVSDYPQEIKALVKGKSIDIIKLILVGPKVIYDLQEHPVKNGIINFDNLVIEIPPNIDITIMEIAPTPKDIKNNTTPSKIIAPIELSFFDDNSRKDYSFNEFRLNTDKVEISGPEYVLNSIQTIKTEPIKSNMLQKESVSVKLIVPNKNIHLAFDAVDLQKSRFSMISKVFTNVPISSNHAFNFFPKDVTIWVKIASNEVSKVNKGSFSVTLKKQDIKGQIIPIEIEVPKNVELIDFAPKIAYRVSN